MSDPLTDALDALRISTTLYAIADLRSPWGVGFPPGQEAFFHLVQGAACVLTVERPGAPAREELRAGDVAFLPHGSSHRLIAGADARVQVVFNPATWVPRRLALTHDEPGRRTDSADLASTRLVCGAVRVRRAATHPIFEVLPDVLVVRAGSPGTEELHLTAQILAAETSAPRPGVDAVLAQLGDVLLAQLLRIWAEPRGAADTGWLAALADREVGRALTALHADLAGSWTVKNLARVAGLSRSRFAERFTLLVGRPPLAHLTGWRMIRAAQLLDDTRSTIGDIARQVGFASEPAFSRTFSRHHGMPPSKYRSRSDAGGWPDRALRDPDGASRPVIS